MPTPEPLSPEQLYNQCDPDSFSFASTADLDGDITISGQDFNQGTRCL